MAKRKQTTKKKQQSRSGYTRDKHPENLSTDEKNGLAVPPANDKGRQAGRIPPAQRKYKARYEAVSAQEAMMNLSARLRGDLDPIKGGLDNDTQDENEEQETGGNMTAHDDFDPLGPADPEPGDPALIAEEKALSSPGMQVGNVQLSNTPSAIDTLLQKLPTGSLLDNTNPYLAQRSRVTLELSDGAMSMSVIDIMPTRYGLTILLPLLEDGVTFIPKPGSEITVVQKENSWKCFFPGTYFECPELSLMGIVFVRADEEAND